MTFWDKLLGRRPEQTPLQKLSKASGLRRKPLSARERRRLLRELEQMRRERPEVYNALVAHRDRMQALAETMYPPEAEHRRLLDEKHPQGN